MGATAYTKQENKMTLMSYIQYEMASLAEQSTFFIRSLNIHITVSILGELPVVSTSH